MSFHASTGQTTTEPEAVLAGNPSEGEQDPVVAWLGGSYFVGYSLGTTVHLKSVDPFTCLPCEGDSTVFTGVASHGLYVTLDEHDVDGLVHRTSLGAGLILDERRHALIARRSGKTVDFAALLSAGTKHRSSTVTGIRSHRIGDGLSVEISRGEHIDRIDWHGKKIKFETGR